MSSILVTYATNSGSTAEVAAAIADELTRAGHSARVFPINAAPDPADFDAVVIGAPMILGWHPAARRYLKRHQQQLAARPVALFACAMRLTRAPGETLPPLLLNLDDSLVSSPARAGRLTLKERFTTIAHYLRPMLGAAPQVKPVSVAFFNGKLETYRLKWWQAIFVMLVVQATPGDYRDWDCIQAWAGSLAGQI